MYYNVRILTWYFVCSCENLQLLTITSLETRPGIGRGTRTAGRRGVLFGAYDTAAATYLFIDTYIHTYIQRMHECKHCAFIYLCMYACMETVYVCTIDCRSV